MVIAFFHGSVLLDRNSKLVILVILKKKKKKKKREGNVGTLILRMI